VNSERTDPDNANRKEKHLPWPTYLQTGATIAAGLVGLTAYVYLLGGAVLWLRIYAARLPADNATVAFQDRVLLATGLKALFFELALLGAVGALVWVVWKAARRLDRNEEREQRQLVSSVILLLLRSLIFGLAGIALAVRLFDDLYAGEDAALVLLAIVMAGLALGAVSLAGKTPKPIGSLDKGIRRSRPAPYLEALLTLAVIFIAFTYMAVALGLTVLVLLALLLLGRRATLLPQIESPKDLVAPVLVIALALNVIIVPYLATPPVTFDHVWVTTRDDEELDGAFLGRTGEGVFLATCKQRSPTRSKEARIQVIPVADVKHVVVGGFKYSFDVGNRPSLYGLIRHFATGDNLSDFDNGLQLDTRKAPDVCGEKASD
jgi:hypothetical protein